MRDKGSERSVNLDRPVKSLKTLVVSFPWKRESSIIKYLGVPWIPAFAGMTTFYDAIKVKRAFASLISHFW